MSVPAVRQSARWSNARRASRCCCIFHGWRDMVKVRALTTDLRSQDTEPKLYATRYSHHHHLARRIASFADLDQGTEMAQHNRLRIDTGIQVYFCDPRSPWQRGTNENTNGLLRQYFPKGTDLSIYSADEISAVAAALNGRPRKTLGWKTPAETLDELLSRVKKVGCCDDRLNPPGVSGTTVVTNACAFYHTTRGCGRIGRPAFLLPSGGSTAPSGFRGTIYCKARAKHAARSRNHVCCLKKWNL